ncbi:hypothetical protein [Staphylococcus casei]|uniref:Uncharacterized protein n=1 Tax=Staphylococcus casei TaxID=201828 RepID=A0ABZ2WDX1_9STAP
MIFIYIILSAILLYYAIKYGIRDGLIDRDTNKEKLIYLQKVLIYLKKLGGSSGASKEVESKAKRIYNEALDTLLSEKKPKEKYNAMTVLKKQIELLNY